MIQLGARNMQNYALLAEVGRAGLPVLLKRGLSATLEELLMAAEYILKEGNPNVMLCERGIRTFETAYRFTLDLTAVPVLKELSHLPVIVDPSHAAGRRSLVEPLSLAAAAAGADGIIVEVHPEPDEAICDGPQQLRADGFAEYAEKVERAAAVAGKVLSRANASGCVRLAILGVGLIGGSIGLAARERLGADVVGFDPAPGALDAALELGAVDRAARDASTAALDGAEAAFVAAPVGALAGAVARGARAPPARTASSPTSARPSATVVDAVDDERFIGGHPLAGAEQRRRRATRAPTCSTARPGT